MQDADTMRDVAGHATYAQFQRWALLRNGLTRQPGEAGRVRARLNWGRWLADCPFCGGAELVGKQTRSFFCLTCGMVRNGRRAMAVVFPPDAAEIEARLAHEPTAAQNWEDYR